jgi:hypothetical protein
VRQTISGFGWLNDRRQAFPNSRFSVRFAQNFHRALALKIGAARMQPHFERFSYALLQLCRAPDSF